MNTANFPLMITYILSAIIMVGLPVFLAIFITRKFRVSWLVVLTGVLTFLVSQALRIPATSGINALFSNGTLSVPSAQWMPVINALLAGSMAALFEESARWAGFKVLRRKAEKFGSALALGAGHGGIESILIFALYTAGTLFTVLFYNPGAEIAKGVSTDQVQYTLAQIQQFWTNPWTSGLLPGVERVIAIVTQIFLSTLVWKAIVDRAFIWWLLAVLYHLVVDAVAVYLSQIGWSYWVVEGILALFMFLSAYLIYRFIKDESEIEKEMEEIADEDLDEEDLDDDDDDDGDDEEEKADAINVDELDELEIYEGDDEDLDDDELDGDDLGDDEPGENDLPRL